MDQSAENRIGRHGGWSEGETAFLRETAREAQSQGRTLKQVFELVAEKTGRRPNSIRNFYYSQAGGRSMGSRFVPFEESEVERLIETVLRHRSAGQSVRACLQEMSGGDHSLMLRYQNKYRSVLKNRPELIDRILAKLAEEGVCCEAPQVRPRLRTTLEGSLTRMRESARSSGSADLISACEVIGQLMRRGSEDQSVRSDRMAVRLDLYRLALTDRAQVIRTFCETADELSGVVKGYLVGDRESRVERLDGFCELLSDRLGRLEGCVTEARRELDKDESRDASAE